MLQFDITVSCVGHALQTYQVFWTCHMITSNKSVELLTK